MPVHRMSLKGPWDYEWIEFHSRENSAIDFEQSGRVKMPMNWDTHFGDINGTIRFLRRFHQPTNLDPDEQVWIVFDGVGGRGFAWMNGHKLGPLKTSAQQQRFEITEYLQPNSEIITELTVPSSENHHMPRGLYAPVALEIVGENVIGNLATPSSSSR